MPSPSIPVPPRWRTVSTERTLLAVVHNVTAATRLLDVLSLFAGDPRIQTVFTCPGSSAFTRGTEEFLSARGIPSYPGRKRSGPNSTGLWPRVTAGTCMNCARR